MGKRQRRTMVDRLMPYQIRLFILWFPSGNRALTVRRIFRLRRELPRRFPDQSTKGAVGYGLLRSLQLRWIRLPKTQVKIGDKLTRRY